MSRQLHVRAEMKMGRSLKCFNIDNGSESLGTFQEC